MSSIESNTRSSLSEILRRSFAFAMPPKRKRRGAHPPPPPPSAPRRRSRRLNEQPIVDQSQDSSQTEIDGPEGDLHKGLLEENMGGKKDLQQTMWELSELDHKLQSVARSHQLAVKTSDLQVEPDSPSELAFKPKAHIPRRDIDLVFFQSPETKLRSPEQTEILPCKVCGKTAGNKSCGRHKAVGYCGENHQKVEWKAHKKICTHKDE
ncbi:hypothetical protein B0T10DRAFT_501705 [Thelonectria olida]|uniref:MYND-type domain-containing protein n=1 Tax=Thelonectria olida TaxID=1576542 RepID=A0A9P8VQ60_9HYPO|nr:hypothetical protein B0T10DRAFT_501705 [Thelonectria olida]